MANKPPRITKYVPDNGKGIGAFNPVPKLTNLFTDAIRNHGNLGSSIQAFFNQQNGPKYGAGDYVMGVPARPQPANALSQNTVVRGRGAGNGNSGTPALDPIALQAPPPKTLLDYINEANGLGLGGGGGTNYDALSGQLRTNGAQGDAKLQAMYDQLSRSVAAEAPAIRQNYAGTGASITQNATDANNMVQQSYNSTRDAQTKQLAALGIGDAAGVLASNGGLAARDQSMASSSIAQKQQAALDSNAAHSASAVQYNTGVGNAAQLAGTEARSALQRQLSTKLAELESAKASAKTSGARNAFNSALQLMQMDPNNPANLAKNQQTAIANELGNQKTASEIAQNQARAQSMANRGSRKTIDEAINGTSGGYKALHDAFIAGKGEDDSQGKNFATFVATMKAVNGIK